MSTNYPNGIPRTLGYSHSYQNLSQDINQLQSNLESYMDSIGIADPGELRSFSLADFYGPNEGPNGTNPNQAKDSINLLLSSTLDLSSPSSFRPSEHTAEPLEDDLLKLSVDPKPFLPCMNGSVSPAPGNGTTSKMNSNSSKPLNVQELAQNYLIPNSDLVNPQMMSHTTTGSVYHPSTSLPQDSIGIPKVPVTNGVPLSDASGPMYPVTSTIPPSILSSIPTSSLRVNNVVDAIPQTTQIPFSVPVNIPVHPPVGSVETPFTTAVPLQYAISPELILNPQGIPLVPILPTALPISTVPQSQPTLNATFPIVSPLPLQRSNSIPESCPSITRTSSSISNSISTASPTPSATDEVEFSTSISPPIPSSSNPTLPLMQPFISTPFVNPRRLPIHNPTGTQNPIQNGILNGDYIRAAVSQDLSSPEAIEFAIQPNFNGTKIMVPGTPSKRY
ncbi:hypothetical protein BKA69DRAFT_1070284 [Paraphysoderma sedebokerense]|nr:hypothetical protein BKA69DRAFT_1070284 [Paraphysoderma sedebokerense]